MCCCSAAVLVTSVLGVIPFVVCCVSCVFLFCFSMGHHTVLMWRVLDFTSCWSFSSTFREMHLRRTLVFSMFLSISSPETLWSVIFESSSFRSSGVRDVGVRTCGADSDVISVAFSFCCFVPRGLPFARGFPRHSLLDVARIRCSEA